MQRIEVFFDCERLTLTLAVHYVRARKAWMVGLSPFSSDVNKTFLSRPRLFSQDQDHDFFFQDQDQDFTRTTEQVTISLSQNEQNSIHRTPIAVYEIKTVGLM